MTLQITTKYFNQLISINGKMFISLNQDAVISNLCGLILSLELLMFPLMLILNII